MDNKIKELKKIQDEWDDRCKKMEENAKKAKSTIILDVGGKIFKTTKDTLLARKDTFFYAMISSGKWLPDEDGSYFIDRNPKLFPYILDYLRNGKIDLSSFDKTKLALLKEEADYYLVSEMISDVKQTNDTFDSNCEGSVTVLSNNNKTATTPKRGHTCVIGNLGISSGKQSWKLKIVQCNTPTWLLFGIISKPISDLQSSYTEPTCFGIAKSQKYTKGVCGTTSAADDWIIGDVIQIDLDCDSGTLKITNLSSGKFEEWKNIPSNTYYLHVNLYYTNDSVTILDQ